MRENFWSNLFKNNLDEIKWIESPLDKEWVWMEAFWNEYKPDFSCEKFFSLVKEKYYDGGKWVVLRMSVADDTKMFAELFSMIKENNFKLDIQFLESLRDDQKKYISQIFLYLINNHLDGKFEKMWKSLLIWMCWWGSEDYRNHYFDREKLYRISKDFEGFNLRYFRQAYDCLSRAWDNDIYHIVKEYNLIKNVDKDLESILLRNTLDLWKWYSLWTFHTRSELSWQWYEEKYWFLELDKEWKEIKFNNVWEKNVEGYKFVLDRNHESVYKDASWILYNEYLDAPTWVALFYRNNPIACMCFYIKNWNELFINQIQKVPYYEYDRCGRCIWKHYSKEVNNVDWKNILYGIIGDLAKKYNVVRIIIQWWENNRRTKEIYEDYETDYFKNKSFFMGEIPEKNKGRVHLDPEIARKIYDVCAEWLWFQKYEDWNRGREI